MEYLDYLRIKIENLKYNLKNIDEGQINKKDEKWIDKLKNI